MSKDNLLVLDGFGSVEEMLGAYMEGNLNNSENEYVTNLLDHNKDLSDLVSEANEIEVSLDDNIFPDNLVDIELPQLQDTYTFDLSEYALNDEEMTAIIEEICDSIDCENQDNTFEDSTNPDDQDSIIEDDSFTDGHEIDFN